MGYYTVLLGKHFAKVVAIEPQARLVKVLKRNIAMNAIANAHIVNAAVGERNTLGKLELSAKYNQARISQKETKKSHTIVEIRTLSSIFSKIGSASDSFLKMDVEGYEYNIVLGNTNFIERNVRGMVLELHPRAMGPSKTHQLLKLLDTMGFTISVATKDAPPYWSVLASRFSGWSDKTLKQILDRLSEIVWGVPFGVIARDEDIPQFLKEFPHIVTGQSGVIELLLER